MRTYNKIREGSQHTSPSERNALIEQYLPLAKSIVGKFKASGLRPQIEADDLESEAFVAIVQTIDSYGPSCGIELAARLDRRIRDAVIAAIKRELKHWPSARIAWEAMFTDHGEPKR